MAIQVILTAYNMGADATEADFDAWASFVAAHIDEAVGCEVASIDQAPFRGAPARDGVSGATDEQECAIRRWLSHEGWEIFCAQAAPEV